MKKINLVKRIIIVFNCLCFLLPSIVEGNSFEFGKKYNQSDDSEIDFPQAIERAKEHLLGQGDKLHFHVYMLEEYLSRRFSAFPEFEKREDHNDLLESVDQIRYFRRLIDGQIQITSEEIQTAGSSIDRVTLRALYCDQFPVEKKFLYEISAVSKKSGYYLTHALWALELLKDNGCADQWPQDFKKIEREVTTAMVTYIDNAGFYRDEVIEAIAFLYSSGHSKLVKPEWVNQVAFSQAKNGGWYRVSTNKETNSKTTMLALWVLLEATNPDAARTSWIIAK